MDWMHLQRHIAEIRELAEAARRAAELAAAVDAVEWRSVAAERFREALRREAALTRRCADLLDDAAQAMAVHARAVQTVDGSQQRVSVELPSRLPSQVPPQEPK